LALAGIWEMMGSFSEDLRMERLSRKITLEHIAAVTKISQRYLVALEEGHFRSLPGGILNKGIVRGYAAVVGLDQNTWTERFVSACGAAGQPVDNDRGWTTFAANVGKARLQRHEAQEIRLRWIGAVILLILVALAGFFTVRYYGVKAGWWTTVMPGLSSPAAPGNSPSAITPAN
jgi:cytoskeletal protein RodZ